MCIIYFSSVILMFSIGIRNDKCVIRDYSHLYFDTRSVHTENLKYLLHLLLASTYKLKMSQSYAVQPTCSSDIGYTSQVTVGRCHCLCSRRGTSLRPFNSLIMCLQNYDKIKCHGNGNHLNLKLSRKSQQELAVFIYNA